MAGHAESLHDLTGMDTVAAAPARQAYHVLHVAFVVAPIIAGLDKFLHLLTNWEQYLAPWIAKLSPIPAHNLMMVFGVIEVIAGLIVAFKPRIGAWIVCAWLCGIILNLVTLSGFYDIALRDLGLALGAAALGLLSRDFSAS